MATSLRVLELLSPLLNVTINPASFRSITPSSSLFFKKFFLPHHSTFFSSSHFTDFMPFSLCLPLHSQPVFVWFSVLFLSLTLELILIFSLKQSLPTFYCKTSHFYLHTYYSFIRNPKKIEKQIRNLPSWETICDRLNTRRMR